MLAGIAFGAWADRIGLKRSMVAGLALLAAASAAGALVQSAMPLLALRALEGFGFLLVVLPAPALLRRVVSPGRLNAVLGLWGAYMPFGAALGLLIGPSWIDALGWRSWWWAIAAISAAMAAVLARSVPAPPAGAAAAWPALLRTTLSHGGPWLVALCFAVYSAQWLAVIGFLPTIYREAGVSAAATGALTALAAAVNMVGNIGAGRLLHRGVAAPALIAAGFVAMAGASAVAFGGVGLPPALRYAAVLAFSMIGGLIPAALFATALRVAPDERTISTTVGWMQQWSAFGQFAGPPLVAWVAMRVGGWEWTWVTTGALSMVGLMLAAGLAATARR